MQSQDLDVLTQSLEWCRSGHAVYLHTVVQTFGSAPRPPGSLLSVRADGKLTGSVSGGCIEDDLLDKVSRKDVPTLPHILTYGVSKEEANRFRLPCGGTLRVVREPLTDFAWVENVLSYTSSHKLVQRHLNFATGMTAVNAASPTKDKLRLDETGLIQVFGPKWRLLLIGAGEISKFTAQMALALDFEVLICDPRKDYAKSWEVPDATILPGMPDDVVEDLAPDAHTAIVTLTHDPKLDDLALITALKSNAFYVGALGSLANTLKRKDRLTQFDLTPEELDQLHGPVGLDLGSRSPAEIAVSILAEIIAIKNGKDTVER
jgi:xanthine dehydrogenase accessory factor